MSSERSGSQETRHICLISGGKDSSALAVYLRDTRPELDVEYVFCDTHKELPEIYEYLDILEGYLGKPIVRLSNDLGDRGFDYWLKMYRGFLPSPSVRWCTKQLKIKPFETYVGEDPVVLYVGIRADENREGYISTKPNIKPCYPFKEDGIGKDDVFRILEDAVVGLPEYYEWRSRSGCYFCFFQRRAEWIGLKDRHPDLFTSAKKYEKPEIGYTWSDAESLVELEKKGRTAQVKKEELERRKRSARRRAKHPATLAELFSPNAGTPEEEEEAGCLICHL